MRMRFGSGRWEERLSHVAPCSPGNSFPREPCPPAGRRLKFLGAAAIACTLLLLPQTGAQTTLLTDAFDAPALWKLEGAATVVDCTTFAPGCALRLAPTRADQNAPPGAASATRIFPAPGIVASYLRWSFTGSVEDGWSDADLLVTMADGTVILVSHTEDRRSGGIEANNGVTLATGNARVAEFATWPAGETQRLTMSIAPGSVTVGIEPADGSRPMIWSAPAPLPRTAVGVTTIQLKAACFGMLPAGPSAYWFDDVEMGLR